MARSVYVAGLAPGAGISLIALGITELLSRRVDRLGLFQPVAVDGDPLLDALAERYHVTVAAADRYGVPAAEAAKLLAGGQTDELVGRIVERYRAVAGHLPATVVVGGDVDRDTGEVAFHARLANELGSVVVAVADGRDGDPDAVRAAYHAFADAGATVLAVVANRVPEALCDTIRSAAPDVPVEVYVVPEVADLAAPTVAEVARALGATHVSGGADALNREVHGYVVGGAHVPTVLDHLRDGSLLITPGDRADLVVASCAAHAAGIASLAGIVLTLGVELDPRAKNLVERLGTGLAILSVPDLSFATVTAAGRIVARPFATPRKIEMALGIFEDHVDAAGLGDRITVARSARVTPMMFSYDLIERARAARAHLVLPEGTEDRLLRAADLSLRRGVADLTLLGDPAVITRRARELGLDLGAAQMVDPATSGWREEFAATYAELRRHKGIPLDRARDMVTDVNYFGTLMVHSGRADGMVSGAVHTTAATIRPAFEIIKTLPDVSVASSVFFMCLADRVLVYGDCAVNPDPDAGQLADIAISSAETAARFGVQPRVAMLSYATGGSGTGADVERVSAATALVRERRPDLPVEGPIQYDAAIDPVVAAAKLPGSAVAGHATVFVFPDLNTGNNTYKAVQRSAGAVAVGPVLQGLRRPVNDLSRGATVADIVDTIAITAIQAAVR
jgi:phosphate acetyltransferase